MKSGQQSFLQHIETLFDSGTIGEQTDRQLLERVTGRDRATAELAFTVLVKRHGPLVFRACRAILHDPHESEDAFQATFLLLARKAPGLWVRSSLGPWLLSVARRVASCARSEASRRLVHERKAAELAAAAGVDREWDDRDAILHEELGRLPEKYRTAVVLCDLEGLTQEQAARRLGWPDGTVRSRLARGRDQLRDRLARRGLSPTAILAGPSPVIEWSSTSLVETTVQAALGLASGRAAIGATASAIALTEGVLTMMFWGKLKATLAIGLAAVLLSSSGLIGYRAMGRAQAPAIETGQPPKEQPPSQRKPAVPASSSSPASELEAIGQARIAVARKLRDNSYRLYQGGEIDITEYLTAQKRYDEAVADVMVKTDADRIRHLESRVAGLKQLEDRARKLRASGMIRESDVLTLELSRLDAEYALAKAKRKAGSDRK